MLLKHVSPNQAAHGKSKQLVRINVPSHQGLEGPENMEGYSALVGQNQSHLMWQGKNPISEQRESRRAEFMLHFETTESTWKQMARPNGFSGGG